MGNTKIWTAQRNGYCSKTLTSLSSNLWPMRSLQEDQAINSAIVGGDTGEAARAGETDQCCLWVRSGAAVAGALVCFDTSPARLAALAGVSRPRAVQNDLTASATAALTTA